MDDDGKHYHEINGEQVGCYSRHYLPPDAPAGLLPVRARGEHEIEAAGGWVVACGAYGEYGCMPIEVRDYIVTILNRGRT